MARREIVLPADRGQSASLGPASPGNDVRNRSGVSRILRACGAAIACCCQTRIGGEVGCGGYLFSDRAANAMEARSEACFLIPHGPRKKNLCNLVAEGSSPPGCISAAFYSDVDRHRGTESLVSHQKEAPPPGYSNNKCKSCI